MLGMDRQPFCFIYLSLVNHFYFSFPDSTRQYTKKEHINKICPFQFF